MSKYYTPDISEFYVGFECEYSKLINTNGSDHYNWNIIDDVIYGDLDTFLLKTIIVEIVEEGQEMPVRVKYLDKEDIESLGFKEYVHSYGSDFRNKTHKVAFWFDNKGIEVREITNSGIGEKCVFSGTIKNKSELKKLLQQLNIK